MTRSALDTENLMIPVKDYFKDDAAVEFKMPCGNCVHRVKPHTKFPCIVCVHNGMGLIADLDPTIHSGEPK